MCRGHDDTNMRFAAWAYPWDLLDDSVSVTERLADANIDEVNLATSYHSVQAFLPHNHERRTFFARASSYFQPGEEYGRLAPVPNETMGDDDWLDEIVEMVSDTHLSLNSWTVGCHNSRLGMSNPDMTLESPYGDSLVFGLCPSNPAVQEYLRALLADLDGRAPFERIELETFDYFHGTGFGWHHDKIHPELGRLGEFLFGLCFCEHCRANAIHRGIDVDAARVACVETLDAIVAGTLSPNIDVAGWLFAHPTVSEYVEVRMETLQRVFETLSRTVDADLGYYLGFFGVEDAWMHGVDPDALCEYVDYYTVLAYESSPSSVIERYETAQQLVDSPLHAGILPGPPAVEDSETVAAIVDALADAGSERVSFYNYGLLPERCWDWVSTATERHV